ncbi:hypothetical protein SAMN05444003_1220 [Cognatiyoonia sediminum]|uniref:Acetolactate synthase n=1 Tax=Cognatiyoonia sediminum TaxID=1508389 RepID=A0A1M5N722_9RHOB|nr:DUF6497 family protein [Cognatiyoonia sediminum]SHG85267.1 hypothetical protein SAMN05444003_1220 [Cognatiyoonia sediminum]
MTTSRSKLSIAAMTFAAFSTPALAQSVPVPSGTEMELFDVIFEENPSVGRFRFIVPAIAPEGLALQFEDVMDDIDYLCDAVVLPALNLNGQKTDLVLISLSEQEIAFGEIDADVTQYFQSFQIIDNTCIWEAF